ncbi:MAG: PfkB family carbohydrate kinase [Jatrophihabitantaceae bacterium]
MPEVRSGRRPIVVGTAALDVLHSGPLGRGVPPVTLRWGGVAHNVACALAACDAAPILITADYLGELRSALAGHLVEAGVDWFPLGGRTPLPLFHGELVDGSVARMHFLGDEALRLLTPRLLSGCGQLFDQASVVVATTDCDRATMDWLAGAAAERGRDFWVVSTDPNEVGKLRGERPPASLVSLNLQELSLWAECPLAEPAEICRAARRIAAPNGRCLVTQGADGAMLVPARDEQLLIQPAPRIRRREVIVGAGDVLIGCLLASRLAGTNWPAALREASELTGAYLEATGDADQPYHSLRRAWLSDRVTQNPSKIA